MSIPSVVQRILWVQMRSIRGSPDQSLFDGYPGHIAAFHALHRLLTPRRPPYTLSNLTTNPQSSWSDDQLVGDLCAEDPTDRRCTAARTAVLARRQGDCHVTLQLFNCQRSGTHAAGPREREHMELTGIEPVTSALQKQRSPN